MKIESVKSNGFWFSKIKVDTSDLEPISACCGLISSIMIFVTIVVNIVKTFMKPKMVLL